MDNSEPNVSNNQDIVPKHEVTKSDKAGDTNNVPNNRSRSSQKGSKQEPIHLESEILHKRKKITYDEDEVDYPSHGNGRGQRCALCKGHNHDERTCENIRYPDNDEVSS